MKAFGMNMRGSDMEGIVIFAAFLALSCAIVSFILLLPEKRRSSLNGFFKVVADIFNFKSLLLEKILKFFYIFSTMFSIILAFFSMFAGGDSAFLSGLIMMIVFPVAIRIVYEFFMMFIILVRNTNDINKKIKSDSVKTKEGPEFVEEIPGVDKAWTNAPAEEAKPEVVSESVRVCPNCGAPIKSETSAFCQKCGFKLS